MKVYLLLVVALASPLGCGKTHTVEPTMPQMPRVYTDQSTPENTLLRMAEAFSNRDTVVTRSVYADECIGTSIDMTDSSPVTLTFAKSDEVRVVAALAQSSTAYVYFKLYPRQPWPRTHYATDPAGWVSIQMPAYKIGIIDTIIGEFEVSAPSSGEVQFLEFTLKPTTPAPTSPTDTTWTIVRWVESRDHL